MDKLLPMINYSFELHDFEEAITAYGTLETQAPTKAVFSLDDFNEGVHFRTGANASNSLQLELEDRLLTILLDESGSMTWNDNSGDRYIYLQRLLTKLDATYPGVINTNIIGFGGSLTRTNLFLAQSDADFLANEDQDIETLLKTTFQDSVFDFAGVRVVRRTDRFPTHPADGVVVAEGIIEAVKDENLVEGQRYYYGIWSFNKNTHFSRGQFISGVPFDRILPQGVNFVSATPRILPGIKRDNFTQLIYSFATNSGTIAFDSSGNGNHGTLGSEIIEDNFWGGDAASGSHGSSGLRKNVGVRFDGQFDLVETNIDSDSDFVVSNDNDITTHFWLYWYQGINEEWIIGTSTDSPTDNIGWAITIGTNGSLNARVSTGSLALTTGANVVTPETWTMVGVKFIGGAGSVDVELSINGNDWVGQGTLAFAGDSVDALYTGGRPVISGMSWAGSDFFGVLNQISISNTQRSNGFMDDLYSQELPIFDQSIQSAADNPLDNKQREILLSWEIGDDFDFSGGNVLIRRKYRSVPSHPDDGELVVQTSASVGEFFFLDSYPFIHGGDYYYRFFTQNSIGNFCDQLEARIVSSRIPSSFNTPGEGPNAVSGETITAGDKKLSLQWVNPDTDVSDWRGTKIFYSPNRFSTIEIGGDGSIRASDGTEIADTTDAFFTHRVVGQNNGAPVPLSNGLFHFYTIITYDELGRISESRLLQGVPSSLLDTVFEPEDVNDIHLTVLNPNTLSIQWNNPTVKTEELELFFGESVVVFVSVKDFYGGNLDDVTNLKLQVCTEFSVKDFNVKSEPLDNGSSGTSGGFVQALDESSGNRFDENCNSPDEEAETVLTYTTVQSGLIKGILTHTGDRDILTRRKEYTMNVRAQYKVEDPDTGEVLFEFNTNASGVKFVHPITMALINKLNKKAHLTCGGIGKIRNVGFCACPTNDGSANCEEESVDGGYINATIPYTCRIELQYRGESLPQGTPVSVSIYRHTSEGDPGFLSNRSTRTTLQEGNYATTAVLVNEVDSSGNPTGQRVSKSIVDISIVHPIEPDWVDLYVSIDYLGFFVDAIHTIRFIGTLFISADIAKPDDDGIDVTEQFSTAWTLDPDFPDDETKTFPVPDGTVIKWELTKLRHGKDRPFYSTEVLTQPVSGVYSVTTSGIAKNVFFGPVGNVESHFENVSCGEGLPIPCCIGEEYSIKASVILGEESAFDGMQFHYDCDEVKFSDKKFLVNAAEDEPGEAPHWITWGDGINMLKFQIARNPIRVEAEPSLSMLGVVEYNECVDTVVGGQNFDLPQDHIVQITAPGEILWNVSFETDPYTGIVTPVVDPNSIVSPILGDDVSIPLVANIPLTGEVTDFFIRLNTFVGKDANPKPRECKTSNSEGISDCEYRSICDTDVDNLGIRWTGVNQLQGRTTIIVSNREVTLRGGGGYESGIPPVYVGWKEPLDLRVIEGRKPNGDVLTELIVDGSTRQTFVVEANFAGEPVPDGTIIEVNVEGKSASLVILSNCAQTAVPQQQARPSQGTGVDLTEITVLGPGGGGGSTPIPSSPVLCFPASSGIIFTRQVNDIRLNPTGDKRALAYFTIEPLQNVALNAKINITCRFDKLGTITREITDCIELNNTINTEPPVLDDPIHDKDEIPVSVTSNAAIVYDTIQDLYETTRAGFVGRMGHFMASATAGTTDHIYVFGGYTGHSDATTTDITPLSEAFDIATQEWEFVADMPTPRTAGMTVEKNGLIYCIGGLSIDPGPIDRFVVSRKLEVFNAVTQVWNSSLQSMPENYGVAFGDAQVNGDFIYVVCGVTSIINSSEAKTMNDKILRYQISTDTWITITPSNVNEYKRIAPFGFVRNPANAESDFQSIYYIYSGSIPKTSSEIISERNRRTDELLDEFRSSVLTSPYYSNLTKDEQADFVEIEEQRIRDGVIVAPFIYPPTGFKMILESESGDPLTMDISDKVDDEWTVLPMTRDRGRCIYLPQQDMAYFMGGSNQNQSTTLNRVESIDFSASNLYSRHTPFNVGRALFGAAAVGDDIYLSGGLTSGHKSGWANIELFQAPLEVQALGTQSSGLFIRITNDSGEVIEEDIRVAARGILRIPDIDNLLIGFLANRAADRALGGDGSGNAPDDPQPGDEIDVGALIKAQNSIIDPNSDEFQFNAARKLNEEVFLFPILYSESEFVLTGGVGGILLKPRSEDPLTDFEQLAEFIQSTLDNTPTDPDERFDGDLTRDELAALGEVLNIVKLPPTIIDTGALRNLYQIETVITILDDGFFGQTVSEFDLAVQDEINSRIREILTPPPEEEDPGTAGDEGGSFPGIDPGSAVEESECLLLQHLARPDVPTTSTPPQSSGPTNIHGTGGFTQSGQCLFCSSLLPLTPEIRQSSRTTLVQYYNATDWIPQVKRRFVTNNTSLNDAITALDIIDHETPFGGSQLYNSMFEAGKIMGGDDLNNVKKSIYICSDNTENLSLISRRTAVDEINAIDGDGKVPVVYTVFSTSFPLSLTSQLERSGVGDVAKITKETGGQSTTLTSSGFLDQILNLTLGSATGGLGYGVYTRRLEFDGLTAFTSMTPDFELPVNTQGFIRFKHSENGFHFTDFSERFVGNDFVDFIDFFARVIDLEVILTTGFTTDITPEYDTSPTGIPKLLSIAWDTSNEREDFLFVDKEDVLTNVQQVAASFEGHVPVNADIDTGVATSNSHDWNDFSTDARPAVNEFGKIFMLERTHDPESVVPIENLTTTDQQLYKTNYGAWDPSSTVELLEVVNTNDVPVLSGFRLYPRQGEVYFNTRQPPTKEFKLTIINKNEIRVGFRLRNRLHSDNIIVSGVGYMYSTNDDKAVELSQVAPRAVNPIISPAAPVSTDTIFALYNYVDLNNDKEQGSILSWFLNGRQALEIQNRTSWSNDDLLLSNKLQPEDKIHFSITPSDGKDFGATAFSPTVIIVAQKPGLDNLIIVPSRNDLPNDRYDTGSVITAEYEFRTEDTGSAGVEHGTIIQWYVNGTLFKEGIFSAADPPPAEGTFSIKAVDPVEVNAGVKSQVIGNQIYVEITPKTLLITGELTRSNTAIIENSIPIIQTITVEPINPVTQSTLSVSYAIDDPDMVVGDPLQTDQSELKWFQSINGIDFVEVTGLAGVTTVDSTFLTLGDKWYAQVTPFDGLEIGPQSVSNTVTVT